MNVAGNRVLVSYVEPLTKHFACKGIVHLT